MKIKSREFECPHDLVMAFVNLEIARSNLLHLARKLNHQANLFDDDAAATILDETADEIEGYLEPLGKVTDEFKSFIKSPD